MAEVVQLVRVNVTAPVTYPNGDRCQFLDHDFLCRWVSGEPIVGDDESSHTGFFGTDQLPRWHRVTVGVSRSRSILPTPSS